MSKVKVKNAILTNNICYRPTTQNSIAEIKRFFKRNDEIAFLIGTGFDIALSSVLVDKEFYDAKKLILKFYQDSTKTDKNSFGNDYSGIYNDYFNTWLIEVASYCSTYFSRQTYNEKIKKLLIPNKLLDSVKNVVFSLNDPLSNFFSAIEKSDLIVTTNYTPFFEMLLRKYLYQKNIKKNVIVYNRENLKRFIPFNSKEIINLIYLHGRFNYFSYPIIDTQGYNIVAESDTYYKYFLDYLFTNRSVISFGYSWLDAPVRNAAALSQRMNTYLFRRHLYVDFIPVNKNNAIKEKINLYSRSDTVIRNFENTCKSTYGLDKIYIICKPNQSINNFTQIFNYKTIKKNRCSTKFICYIKNYKVSELEKINPLIIANILDINGDYESPNQRMQLIRYIQKNLTSFAELDFLDCIQIFLEKFYQLLIDYINQLKKDTFVEDWVIVSRIERHLRHYFYLYNYPKYKDRGLLWKNLFNKIPTKKNWKKIDMEVRFHFLTGFFETQDYSENELDEIRLLYQSSFTDNYKSRLRLCSDIWLSKEKTEKFSKITYSSLKRYYISLHKKLLQVGWEGIASKIILDLVCIKIKKCLNHNKKSKINFFVNEEDQYEILEFTQQGINEAKYSGCFRREVKGEVLKAMYSKDPSASRTILFNKLKIMEKREIIEPGLKAAIIAGLTVCMIREMKQINRNILKSDLINGIVEQLCENNIKDVVINNKIDARLKNNFNFWTSFSPIVISDIFA